MAEYIEKWSVVNRLIDLENEFQHYKPFHGFEHAMYRKVCEAEIAIGKTPTADVVEVVRCKDCKHWYEDEEVCLKIYSDGAVSSYAWQNRNPDDFCSYGERMEDT